MTIGAGPGMERVRTTGPSAITARPSSSIPSSRTPTPIEGSPGSPSRSTTRRLTTTIMPWSSIPRIPWSSTIGAGRGRERRDFDKAISDFDRALQVDPKFARAYTNRGIAWASRKDFSARSRISTRRCVSTPSRARPYLNRGIALAATGDHDAAIDDFNRALEIDPKSTWTRYNRLVAYFNTRRPGAAAEARQVHRRVWLGRRALHSCGPHRPLRRPASGAACGRRGNFLDEAAQRSDASAWAYQLVKLLRGEIDEKALLAIASDTSRKTEIHAFLGLRETISGRPQAALPHLRWVKEHGTPSDAGYRIAIAELNSGSRTSVAVASSDEEGLTSTLLTARMNRSAPDLTAARPSPSRTESRRSGSPGSPGGRTGRGSGSRCCSGLPCWWP